MTDGVRVTIFGHELTVQGGDPEDIRVAANFLDRQIKDVSEVVPGVDQIRILILTALNIADELIQLRKQESNPNYDNKLETLARQLETRLTETLDSNE